MSEPLRVEVAWPPSVNGLWRNSHGRTILSRPARAWRKANLPLVMAAMLEQGVRTLADPASLAIDLFPPDDKRRRDISNSVKALEDLLVHAGALLDDAQVCCLLVTRRAAERPGRAVLWLRAAREEDMD